MPKELVIITNTSKVHIYEAECFQKSWNGPSRIVLDYYKEKSLKNLGLVFRLMLSKDKTIACVSPSILFLFCAFLKPISSNTLIYVFHEPKPENFGGAKWVIRYNKILLRFVKVGIVFSQKGYDDLVALDKGNSDHSKIVCYPFKIVDRERVENPQLFSFLGNISENKQVERFFDIAADKRMSAYSFFFGGRGNLPEVKYHENTEVKNEFLSDEEYTERLCRSKFIFLPYKSITQSAVVFDCWSVGAIPVLSREAFTDPSFVHKENCLIFDLDKYADQFIEFYQQVEPNELEVTKNKILYDFDHKYRGQFERDIQKIYEEYCY